MRFLFYTHSLISDWNHGNAHFQRGVMRDLIRRGHEAVALEPADSWSRLSLFSDQGASAVDTFREAFPDLRSITYGSDFPHEERIAQADVVIVHEWTDPALAARIGQARRNGGRFRLLFHDTHHRAVSAADEMAAFDLADYDAVLAFGEVLRQRYLDAGWGRQVFTWHEAADTSLFRPMPDIERTSDLIWVGNWGDDERSAEIIEFLVGPVRDLRLTATVRGVRYPESALRALDNAGIAYGGWIANPKVPSAFARRRMTVHIPRRPYVEALPGIPTIRVFEALACGIPLVSAPWDDCEGLFRSGRDYLVAADGDEMRRHLHALKHDQAMADELARCGLEAIHARHSCRHRVDELFAILDELGAGPRLEADTATEAAE
jgi:spore maturation protein CgeB